MTNESTPPAVTVKPGYVQVPIRMNRAMQQVVQEEDWEWADLLAAAEAVTEEQYGAARNPQELVGEVVEIDGGDDEEGPHAWVALHHQVELGMALYAAPQSPKLEVWFGPMPESNGKTNWTAILHTGDITSGFTIARSEFKDRVRYDADSVRHMIGELPDRPDILAYDGNLIEAPPAPLKVTDMGRNAP